MRSCLVLGTSFGLDPTQANVIWPYLGTVEAGAAMRMG